MTALTEFRLLFTLLLLLTAVRVVAGQGTTCADFNKFSAKEQSRYLEGYRLGAAMELSYFKNNVLTPKVKKELEASSNETLQAIAEWGIENYLWKKYRLIYLAAVYPADFHQNLSGACLKNDNFDIGLFDVIPSTLEQMHATGKYPVQVK